MTRPIWMATHASGQAVPPGPSTWAPTRMVPFISKSFSLGPHPAEVDSSSPGSVALALRPAGERKAVQLFTGDCLFPGGVGKTWEPGAFEELLGDVTSQLFGVYGDDTVVYPGHGDDTTLGAERPHLAEWRERGW